MYQVKQKQSPSWHADIAPPTVALQITVDMIDAINAIISALQQSFEIIVNVTKGLSIMNGPHSKSD